MTKRILLSCLVLTVTVALFAQADLQPLVSVKLNKTESITLKQLKARCETYQKQAGVASFTVDQKKEILNSYIGEKLILQAAAKAGIALTDSQTNELYLTSLANQVGQKVTEMEFAAMVKQQTGKGLDEFFREQLAMTIADYKNFIKNQYIAQQYIMMQRQSEMQTIAATDSEIRSFYEINKSSFVQNDIMKLFLVIVKKNNKAAFAKVKIDGLYDDYTSGTKTLNDLKLKMNAPDAGYQAGDMYVSKNAQAANQLGLDYNGLLKLFENAKGFTSEITETPDDYQFYVVVDKYKAKMLEIGDVVQPDSTTTVYEYIRAQLTQQKQTEYFNTAVKEISEQLRIPENYQMLKTGDALDKLLNW